MRSGDAPTAGPRRSLRPLAAATGVVAALALAEVLVRALGLTPGSSYLDSSDAQLLEAWLERTRSGGLLLAGQDPHPGYGWTNRPGLRDFEEPGHPPRSTNTAGMRGAEEFERDRLPERARIALVGDSFTFGTHQPDERIWAAQLARSLPDCEVLNFGVPGFGLDQAVLRLEREALDWRPDVVVLGVFATNPVRATRRFTFFAKPRFGLDSTGALIEPPLGVPVPEPSELLLDPEAWFGAELPRSHSALWELVVPQVAPPAPDVERMTRALLARAHAACAARGARLLVLNIPTLRWRELAPPQWERAYEILADLEDAELLDARDPFDAAVEGSAIGKGSTEKGANGGSTVELYIPGRHFSPAGHRVLAAGVSQRLDALGWLDPGDRSTSGR
ncbi:MAG: SGNH/GDSL hydrolase family protein [Planctomycetota bacterium]